MTHDAQQARGVNWVQDVMRVIFSTRQLGGVVLRDWLRYERAISNANKSYLALCNRGETLEGPIGEGYRCLWNWTSDLHAPKSLPSLGLRLLERALSDHPIRRATAPTVPKASPTVSFLVGHRGMERWPLLNATLESIAGQEGTEVECIVVEQDVEPRIKNLLPSWVRYIHAPPPSRNMPYCRSWTFNIGEKHAASEILVLHDNDMLVPRDYASTICAHVQAGYEVVNLKRFVFYLTEQHTLRVLSGTAALTQTAPLSVVQNLEGGGSVAITRKAYDSIGGMDESFIGWGGEDNEFWERAQTLKVWSFAFLPIVHLWHTAQPEKAQRDDHARAHFEALVATPVDLRIARLRTCSSGKLSGPAKYS